MMFAHPLHHIGDGSGEDPGRLHLDRCQCSRELQRIADVVIEAARRIRAESGVSPPSPSLDAPVREGLEVGLFLMPEQDPVGPRDHSLGCSPLLELDGRPLDVGSARQVFGLDHIELDPQGSARDLLFAVDI